MESNEILRKSFRNQGILMKSKEILRKSLGNPQEILVKSLGNPWKIKENPYEIK